MNSVRPLAVLGLVVVAALAGCYYPTAPYHEVGFRGTVAAENGTFRMNGTIRAYGGATHDRTYRHVHVALYDGDRQLIDAFSVAPLSTLNGTTDHVAGRSDVIPTYVVIESPDFWTGEDLHVLSYRLKDGSYVEYVRKKPKPKAKFHDGSWF